MERTILKCHDFSRFSMTVRTLFIHHNVDHVSDLSDERVNQISPEGKKHPRLPKVSDWAPSTVTFLIACHMKTD